MSEIDKVVSAVLDEIEKAISEKETTLEERAADGGTMTIKRSMCYQDIVQILLTNGYFVCCHNEADTIVIEFRK